MDQTESFRTGERKTAVDPWAASTTVNGGTSESMESIPERLGAYNLGPEIGRGGMGVVYLATETGLNRKVALKVLPANRQLRQADRQRFRIEAQAAAQLNHENIVPIFQIGEENEIQFYAMKLIDGSDLSKLIRTARYSLKSTERNQGSSKTTPDTPKESKPDSCTSEKGIPSLDLSEGSFSASMSRKGHASAGKLARSVANVGVQVAGALHHAHQRGIIHRDIKPSNLLLDTEDRVWVTDFGLAHLQNSPALTQTGDLIGTLRYMSPEQASGRRGLVDHRTDIYSLGVTLYELATLEQACRGQTMRDVLRELTFERPTPVRKLNPRLPSDFETIICKATERNPADRYQTAEQLASDLQRFVRGEKLETRRTPRWKYVRDWLYERPSVAASIALAAVLLVAMLSTGAWALRSRLITSEGQRWKAESALALSENNQGLALARALKASSYTPGHAANQAILAALQELRESKRIELGDAKPGELVFSPDGSRLFKCVDLQYFLRGLGQPMVFDAITGEVVARLEHSQPITTATFSPDNSLLLTSGTTPPRRGLKNDSDERPDFSRSPVAVWNVNDLSVPPRNLAGTRAVRLSRFAFSPVERHAVLPRAEGNEAVVFNTLDWSQEVLILRGGHSAPIIEAIYSPDGRFIATWSEDGTVVIWNASDGAPLKSFDFDERDLPYSVYLQFSSNSKELMVRGWSGAQTYSTSELKEARYFLQMHAKYMGSEDHLLVKSFTNTEILVYGPYRVARCVSEVPLEDFTCVGDKKWIAASAQRGSVIKLFNSHDGSLLAECRGHTDWIRDLAERPGSEQFATISWDDTIRIWNTATNAQLRTVAGDDLKLSEPALAFSDNGKRAIVSSISAVNSTVHQIDSAAKVINNFDGEVETILQDGRLVIEELGGLSVVNASTSRRDAVLTLPNETVAEVIERVDGNGLLLITDSRRLLSWSIEGRQLVQLSKTGQAIVDVVINPANGDVLAGTQNGELLRWEQQDTQPVEIARFNAALLHLDLNSTGDRVLISTVEQQAIVWDMVEQLEIAVIASDTIPIEEAWFAADGQLVVTHANSRSEQLALWDIDERKLIASIEVGPIRDFDASPDRTQFAIGSSTEGGFIWDVGDDSQTKITVTERPCGLVRFIGKHLVLATLTTLSRLPQSDNDSLEKTNVSFLLFWHLGEQQVISEQLLGVNATELHVDELNSRIAVAARSYGAAVLGLDGRSSVERLLGHARPLVLAAFLKNEDVAITVSNDGSILVHDLVASSQALLGRHEYPVTAAALAPDRSQLVTSDASGKTIHWDVNNRGKVREFNTDLLGVWATQHLIGADNIHVVSSYGTDRLGIWDLRSGKMDVEAIAEGVRTLSLSPDGSKLLVLNGKRGLSVSPSKKFDLVADPEPTAQDAFLVDLDSRQQTPITVEDEIVDVRFLPDGENLAFLSKRGAVLLLDVETQDVIRTIESDSRCLALLDAYAPTDTLFGITERGIDGWDWHTGEQVFALQADQVHVGSRVQPSWMVTHPNAPWQVFYSGQSIIKVPKEPARYASELAPWILE